MLRKKEEKNNSMQLTWTQNIQLYTV